MTRFPILLAGCVAAFALTGFSVPQAVAASPQTAKASDISAAKSATKRKPQRHATRRPQPRQGPGESAYRSGTDPSLGPDGKPYPVPPYLRGQCYVDEGYGRFSACPNR